MKGTALEVIGEAPLAQDGNGKLLSRIGTLFVRDRALVTLPRMTHAMQRLHYQGRVNAEADDWEDAVDLIMEGDAVLIRPNPSRMGLAFEADGLLQTIVSKQDIRFLFASDERVQEALRTRGEYWRISPRPKEDAEVAAAIGHSKIAIGGLPVYYYNLLTGTRYLTLQTFRDFGKLEPEQLRQHLAEIQEYAVKRNRLYNHEIDLFGLKPGSAFGAEAFTAYDFKSADAGQLCAWHRELCETFEEAAEEGLKRDNVDDAFWRNRMLACLVDARNDTQSDVLVNGLTKEFFRQIDWLPGGRIEHRELIFDSIFNEPGAQQAGLCDTRVKGFIFNFVREFGELEYVNIGRLLPGLRNQPAKGAHRAYIAEVKHRNTDKPILRILRVQKYGIKEHLEEHNDDLLRAIMETQDYTEYTLDRRLGCWELGMPVPERFDVHTIPEEYDWRKGEDCVSRIWVTYYERDFIGGLATDKVTKAHLENTPFAFLFANWLGRTAAPNMVVGRMTADQTAVLFDQGDEMLILDKLGLPMKILVADHAGTFAEYEKPLAAFAEAYAKPILSRLDKISKTERRAFVGTYLSGMEDQLRQMQEKYRKYRQGFDSLFQHSKQGKGSFAFRWRKVLDRLDGTDMKEVVSRIRAVIEAELNKE